RGRAVRSGQGHVDRDGTVVADVDLVDQTELVDVGRDFGIVDRLECGYDLVGEPPDLVRRQGATLRRRDRSYPGSILRQLGGGRGRRAVSCIVSHAKKSCAFIRAAARTSISSRVL